MAEKHQRPLHVCTCQECEQHPLGETTKLHASINRVLAVLGEKSRRRFVGLLATQHGYGAVRYLARVTGLSRTTILRGQREIAQVDAEPDSRIRAAGGGRLLLEKKTQACSTRLRS
jgi:hypothetical protein